MCMLGVGRALKSDCNRTGEEVKTNTDDSSEELCCKSEKKNWVAAGGNDVTKEGIFFFP